MESGPIYLNEADVASLVDLNDAIAALETILLLQARGRTQSIPKALATFADGSSLHALGSFAPEAGVGGFKTWVNTKRGATAVMSIFDIDEGRLLAILQAGVLGQLRTAGIAGVATDWLADPAADELALIGTGRQAMLQAAAVSAVRKLRRIRVHSRTEANRAAFAAGLRERFAVEVAAFDTVEATVAGAPIVTLVTRASSPFLDADMLDPNAHLNAVGAILPANAEFAQDVFDKAASITVDSVEGVKANSREFIDRFGKSGDWSTIATLGQVILAGRRPRPPGISLFKAMGMGVSDLAVADLVVRRARDGGSAGMPMTATMNGAAPRWTSKA